MPFREPANFETFRVSTNPFRFKRGLGISSYYNRQYIDFQKSNTLRHRLPRAEVDNLHLALSLSNAPNYIKGEVFGFSLPQAVLRESGPDLRTYRAEGIERAKRVNRYALLSIVEVRNLDEPMPESDLFPSEDVKVLDTYEAGLEYETIRVTAVSLAVDQALWLPRHDDPALEATVLTYKPRTRAGLGQRHVPAKVA